MKVLAVFFSIIVSFLALELFTRFIIDNGMNYEIEMMKYANKLKIISPNEKIGIEHKKNRSAKLMNTNISLDSNGFRRDKELNFNSKKILMIGDSMTLGWGASEPFSNVVEKMLNNNYEVVNSGIGNTNTIMQINNFFENFSKVHNYELIVLNFFINDFENVIIKKPNFIQKYSYSYTYLSSILNKLVTNVKLKKNWQSFYKSSFENEEIKITTFNEIIKLRDYCKKNKIKFFINNIPELRNLKDYKFEQETLLIKNFSEKNNIMFYDSISALKNFEPHKLWVTKDDPHANNLAHKILAEFLINHIKKNLDL